MEQFGPRQNNKTMSTQAGSALAEQRMAFMHIYLDEFRGELEI